MMNKRLQLVSSILYSQSMHDADGDVDKAKTLKECREDAATVLVSMDMVMLSPELVTNAIINAGYEPADHMESFMKIITELNNTEEDMLFLNDMQKAWAEGHENGFWDARQTDKTAPNPVEPVEHKGIFTADDVKTAEKQGYVAGWHNAIQLADAYAKPSAETVLYGAEHAKATNPYNPTPAPGKNA